MKRKRLNHKKLGLEREGAREREHPLLARVHKREGKRVLHLLNAVFVVQRSPDSLLHIVT